MRIRSVSKVVVRNIVGLAILGSGVASLVRRTYARRRISILVYHDPDPQTLWRHLRFLARRYSIISMDDACAAWQPGRWRELPPYPLVVTLDDGHRGNMALAPVFQEFEIRPTIFLSTRIVGTQRAFWWQTPAAVRLGVARLKSLPDKEMRALLAEAGYPRDKAVSPRQALSWDEARALSRVAGFGSHTCYHPILPNCDQSGVEEVAQSRRDLEDQLGGPCRHFAYPNGDVQMREVGWVRQAGYVSARTTEPDWNEPETPIHRLKAILVPDRASVPWLAAKLASPALRRWKSALGFGMPWGRGGKDRPAATP